MNKSATVHKEIEKEGNVQTLNFKKLNNITGWSVFAIATIVYLLTVERTASFWDCGEFIACAYKLQVPHPPGAPFFLLVGRVFSMLAFGDVSSVAYWVNILSVLSSGFTILFLFWSIVLFGAKLFPGHKLSSLSDQQIIVLLCAAAVGSLTYTFSDSFWFSAVEAEVYALSSFFTAFVVWAILKWELIEDESLANRWLILIAYMTGLSIGIHLLNLVTMPALGLVYYYKKYKNPTLWGVLATLAISGAIIILIMNGLITGLPSIAFAFEIFFKNSLGLPFVTGAIFVTITLIAALVYGILYSIKKQNALLNTALTAFAFILIGYASYGIALIRSNYNPPINENDPSDIIKFISYLKREQYGDRPLAYGPTFNSRVMYDSDGYPIKKSKGKLYRTDKKTNRYEVYGERKEYLYQDNMLLPRVYSRQSEHIDLYKQYLNISDEEIKERDDLDRPVRPTMGDNLKFLTYHQLGHMYWRYFLWNFAGRESDIQDAGALSPFESKAGIPAEIAGNKARNQFYAIPLLLGLLGLLFTYLRSQQTFFITLMLFFLTGMALVLYLNSPPTEPRERDYIYAGSFYVFAMWIGFAVIYLWQLLTKYMPARIAAGLATALCLLAPALMAAEGWDDHNRAYRYYSVDSAKNLLNSCAPNAILFTGGDNDTFPLWYVQEVEGFRTDVRVCNLSLLGTDWYINQMKRKAYQSDPLPISMKEERYLSGINDQLLFADPKWGLATNLSKAQLEALSKQGMDLRSYLDLINNKDKRVTAILPGGDDEEITIIPSKKMVYKFDRKKVLQKKIIPASKDSLLKGYIEWDLRVNDILKNDLIVLDIIATNNWERPVYFAATLSQSSYLNLWEYLQREGLAFRLLPLKVAGATQGYVNTDIMYDNLINKFQWRQLNNPKSYYDENYLRTISFNRNAFSKLCLELIREGKIDKAKKAALFSLEKMPNRSVPYDVFTPPLADVLIKCGETKKGMEILQTMGRRAEENLAYLLDKKPGRSSTIESNLLILNQVSSVYEANGKEKEAKYYEKALEKYYNMSSR